MSRSKEEAEPLLLQSDTSHDGLVKFYILISLFIYCTNALIVRGDRIYLIRVKV
jgi:hypothetical protein